MVYCPGAIPDSQLDLLACAETRALERAGSGDDAGGYEELTQAFERGMSAADEQPWRRELLCRYESMMLRYAAAHFPPKRTSPPRQALERARSAVETARGALGITEFPSQENSYRDLPKWIGEERVEVVLHQGKAESATPHEGRATIFLPVNAIPDLAEVMLVHEVGHVLLNYRARLRTLFRKLPEDLVAARLIHELGARQEALARMFAATWFLMPDREALFGGNDGGRAAAELVRQRRVETS